MAKRDWIILSILVLAMIATLGVGSYIIINDNLEAKASCAYDAGIFQLEYIYDGSECLFQYMDGIWIPELEYLMIKALDK